VNFFIPLAPPPPPLARCTSIAAMSDAAPEPGPPLVEEGSRPEPGPPLAEEVIFLFFSYSI
jgi:hypothetical protein